MPDAVPDGKRPGHPEPGFAKPWLGFNNLSDEIEYPGYGPIRFGESAFKHGVSEDESRYVLRHCGMYFLVPPPKGSEYNADRLLFLGDNQRGVALEILATRTDDGALFVFHAKKMGQHYRGRYEQALRWRR